MPPESATARELTRALIDRQGAVGDNPDVAAHAARDACECVSAEFSRWVGARGYEALLSRALAETRPAHPALEQIHHQFRSEAGLAGVAESIERHGAGATAQGIAALLETVLAVLGRLIGDDIVVTLVEKSMENCSRADLRLKRHFDQRSATP